MEMVLLVVGGLLSLAGFVGAIWLLVVAFQDSVGQGLLCLCVPCYGLYYAFARLESPYKGWIIGLWLGAGIPGSILVQVAQNMMENAHPR